jgi:glycosidase
MNEIISGGIKINDSSIVHNSAVRRYREPLGAVGTGTKVELRLFIDNINYTDAKLVVHWPDGVQVEYGLAEGAGNCGITNDRALRDAHEIENCGNTNTAAQEVESVASAGKGVGDIGNYSNSNDAGTEADRRAREVGYSINGNNCAGTEDRASTGNYSISNNITQHADTHGKPRDRNYANAESNLLKVEIDAPMEEGVIWYWFRVELTCGGSVYYGADFGGCAGAGKVYHNPPPAFQLTVYKEDFRTPDWAKGAICYQIFPDRYKCSSRARAERGLAVHHAAGRTGMRLHEKWNEQPDYLPVQGRENYEPLDFFGGDLAGIKEDLSRLASLGVGLIYLNPIFEAASNHRYDTGDYLRVDPLLGDEKDFSALVDAARELGIRVILDGVFSHTGDDSVYFNKYGRYDNLGAYRSKDSPYFPWYRFSEYPDKYDSWWGFGTLPEVNETEPTWIDFVIENKNSVLNTWLARGAAGYRLDVADELPDETIARMRAAIKSTNPESFLVGEVWEDATIKQSYNIPRKYALGRGLDSVMNYPLMRAITDYLLGHMDSFALKRFLVSQNQNYPREMYFALMNLLSSHDVARVRSALALGTDARDMTREEQAVLELTDEQRERGAALQRLAAAVQFAVPGMPTVYYGDEVGMTGLLDPFNRCTFVREDPGFEEFYRRLAELRRARPAFTVGSALFYATDGNVLGVLRHTMCGTDAFGNLAKKSAVLTLVNPHSESRRIAIDLAEEKECMSSADIDAFHNANWTSARSLITDAEGPIREGLLEIEIKPYGVEVCDLT